MWPAFRGQCTFHKGYPVSGIRMPATVAKVSLAALVLLFVSHKADTALGNKYSVTSRGTGTANGGNCSLPNVHIKCFTRDPTSQCVLLTHILYFVL